MTDSPASQIIPRVVRFTPKIDHEDGAVRSLPPQPNTTHWTCEAVHYHSKNNNTLRGPNVPLREKNVSCKPCGNVDTNAFKHGKNPKPLYVRVDGHSQVLNYFPYIGHSRLNGCETSLQLEVPEHTARAVMVISCTGTNGKTTFKTKN